MQTKEKHDVDALLEHPEIKEAFAEFGAFKSKFREEVRSAFILIEGDELPDFTSLNEEYDSRLRELKDRIRAVVKADR